MKHANIAIFVPHLGCPRDCSFCNQQSISGANHPPTADEVDAILNTAKTSLQNQRKPAQIAFFGGSFTAMPQAYMLSLLKSANKYIDGENFNSIRISTRPDAINDDVLTTLKAHNVADIELGAQSMDDDVLAANNRGHAAADTINSAALIKQRGFKLGLQMMTGLYQSSARIDRQTAAKLADLNPDYMRIYPTQVLAGTTLAALMEDGKFKPQTLEEAVRECAWLLEFFTDRGIDIIRIGLHDAPQLSTSAVGPHHPAFRELCESKILYDKILAQLSAKDIARGEIEVAANSRALSKIIGQNRENIIKLEDIGYLARIIRDDNLKYLDVIVNKRA